VTEGRGTLHDHRFGVTQPFTLGVEEEFMLLDPETLDLAARVEPMLAAERDSEFAGLVSPELFESVLEVHTPICSSAGDAARELSRLRVHVAELATAHALLFGASGTHPFSFFERQRITARDRYRGIVQELQYAARRELNFGLHVHVGVDDPERAIAVVNSLRAYLGELIALSANSPFWRGELTGVASSRQLVFATMPRTGPPPPFRDYAEFVDVVGRLTASGCLDDYTQIWWDVRPHPRFGTVELRVMDAVTDVEDVVALAAYVQSLVKRNAESRAPDVHPMLVSENRWRATRYGLQATLIDLDGEGHTCLPATRLVRRRLRELRPHARELGCERELDGIHRILRRGTGADRQLTVFGANHDAVDVARDIAERTARRLVPA
jgi:carboxylate-amine ligase